MRVLSHEQKPALYEIELLKREGVPRPFQGIAIRGEMNLPHGLRPPHQIILLAVRFGNNLLQIQVA